MKRFIILPLVLLLIVMTAVAVSADKPVKGSEDVVLDWLVFDCADHGDYDFEVWNDEVFRVNWIDHYDKAGNWVKSEWHVKGVDRVYNRNNPDRFSEGHFAYTIHARPVPDEPGWVIGILNGVIWNIQLPGEGTVYHKSGWSEQKWYGDYGNELQELRRKGLDKKDHETLCRYLNVAD